MLRSFSILLLYFSLTFVSNISLAHTINWLTNDFAPYYILTGQYKHQGRDEKIISLLQQQLPHISFKNTVVPSNQLIQAISDTASNACVLSLYKNDNRKKHMYFTQEAATIGLSPSIALHKKLAKLLIDDETSVSLSDLLKNKKLTLGLSLNRSYGREIDELVNSMPRENIVIRPTRDSLASLTYMLNLKQIDILLGYPSEHAYLAKLMRFDERLTQVPLIEAPEISYGYIGCSKNVHGKQNIAILNEKLKIIKKTKAYKDALLSWLPTKLKPVLRKKI